MTAPVAAEDQRLSNTEHQPNEKRHQRMRLRTVCLFASDVDEYLDWLNDNGLPVVRSRSLEYGRIVEITFGY